MSAEPDDPLDRMAEEYAARLRAGECPDPDDYARRLPGRTTEVREVLSGVAMMESLKRTGDPVPEPLKMSAPPPDRLGEFRLVREIGRGGMGVVYEAIQEPLGRVVAVKVLPGRLSADPVRRTRFQREAQAAARLHHTHIVPVFAVGEADGHSYFAMQFIRGRPLDRAAADTAPGTPATPATGSHPNTSTPADHTDPAAAPTGGAYYRWAARLIADAADALEHAHAQGVLHRDVKPSNLLVDHAGQVWITDFGVAKLKEEDDLTGSGEVVGTLRYMPPERFYGVSDAQGDVYGLGLTLYELLTRRAAFPDVAPSPLIKLITDNGPPRPRKVTPDLPVDLETVVLTAIARDRSQRYRTAAAFAADLRRFLDDRPIRARRTGPLGRLWRWGRRNPALAGATGAAVLLLFVVAVVSSVAWAVTHQAMADEADQRAEAEKTADRALNALNQTFEELAPKRLTVGLSDSSDGPRPAGLTPEGLRILKTLLVAYREIAADGFKHDRLARRVAEANHRIGDLSRVLGELPEAEAAYRRAIALYGTLPGDHRLEAARACNGCGAVLFDLYQFDAATALHERAVELLEDADTDGPVVRFELASAYAALDRWDLLYQPDGVQRKPNRAIPILWQLLAEPVQRPEYRHLLAVCLANHDREDGAGLDLFRQLIREYPDDPAYRADFCRAVSQPGPQNHDLELLEDARSMAAELSARYPDAAEYTFLHAQVLEKMGMVKHEAGRSADAEEPLRDARDILFQLVERHPAVTRYAVRLGMIERILARTLLDQNTKLSEAKGLLESAVRRGTEAYRADARLAGLGRFLGIAYTELADVRGRLGDKAGQAEAAKEAGRYPDR